MLIVGIGAGVSSFIMLGWYMDAFVRVVEFKHLQESGGETWIVKWAEDKVGGIKQAYILTNLNRFLSVTCEGQVKHWQAEAASALGLW